MRIEFMTPERNAARLTRGHLWWRETALVRRDGWGHWCYDVNGFCGAPVDGDIQVDIVIAAHDQRQLERVAESERHWVRS